MPNPPDPNDTAAVRAAIGAIWRIESGRLIAGLARITGDLSQAEDMAQEARDDAAAHQAEREDPM